MAVSAYSTTASDNTSISGITVSNATTPDALDNIIRQLMADIKAFYDAVPQLAATNTFTGTVDMTGATVNFAAGELGTADYADSSVTTVKIADSAITTAKVTDGAVTTAKVADSAITSAKIASGTIGLDDLSASIYGTSGASKLLQLNSAGALPAVSGANLTNIPSLGIGQTWQDVSSSRSAGSSYQNTTGKPITVAITGGGSIERTLQVSTNGSTWVTVATIEASAEHSFSIIVPPNHYYRVSGAIFVTTWAELR